jgi:hypothetical protein
VGSFPAEGIIQFTVTDSVSGTAMVGNTFYVDEVSLNGLVGTFENPEPAFVVERISPNPAAATATVYYGTTAYADVRFEIMDMQGRVMKSFAIPGEIPGRHKVDFDVSALAAGCYLLRMSSPEGHAVTRLQVAH